MNDKTSKIIAREGHQKESNGGTRRQGRDIYKYKAGPRHAIRQ